MFRLRVLIRVPLQNQTGKKLTIMGTLTDFKDSSFTFQQHCSEHLTIPQKE
jgi:hypothetical protein